MEDIWDNEEFLKIEQKQRHINKAENVQSQSSTGFGPNIKQSVGLCASCRYFIYIINDIHQLIYAKCDSTRCNLGKHKIKECSAYKKRGQIDIEDMFQIATMINPEDIKDEPGFLSRKK